MAIKDSRTIPERMEKHESKNWFHKGFNHKTTLTMGELVPFGCKEVYPGEVAKCAAEFKMRFAALYLPIMHQCYFTVDWFYVRKAALWAAFEQFMMQDPVTGGIEWAWFGYKQSDAVFTNGIMNYMGFNAPPGTGTLIAEVDIDAAPPFAYYQIWRWYYRNPNIQEASLEFLTEGDNSSLLESILPDLRVKRRNWPRDYYTIATPLPQQGSSVLVPSYATDPVTGDYVPQAILGLDGSSPVNQQIKVVGGELGNQGETANLVLQLSSTMLDFRYAAQMQEFLERAARAGATTSTPHQSVRWNDFVKRFFDWDPNPLMIDRPVFIGGYTGDIIIQDVMATAETGAVFVGDYAGKALASDDTPTFVYTVPDYGYIIPIVTVYPKASYYSGSDRMWMRKNRMDYMWEQFAYIGDQPMKNQEVWFSWYDADIDWNNEIFGYVPQYHNERYSNDIVSGQMRTLWQSFHLGRKFTAASQVALNSDFITCTPDIGRVFRVDAEAGEHECYVHSYISIDILRRLPVNALPSL